MSRAAPGMSRTRAYVKSYSVTLALEDAEFQRHHRQDFRFARSSYRIAADSATPLHSGLGWLGIAELNALEGVDTSDPIGRAQKAAERCNVPFLEQRVGRLAAGETAHFPEVFYP